MRYAFTALLIVLTLTLSAAEKPNIILIVADDIGYSDLGCYGGEIETPALDGLAAQGLRFTNYYVNNMCWPTRASLMTGLYPKTALPKKGAAEGGLHPQATTLPQALNSAGYSTFMSGKWHLSDPTKPDGPGAPHHVGFDRFFGTIYGASDFFAPSDVQLNGRDMTYEWNNNPDYYYTDAIGDRALQFLKEREAKPFFLYMTFTAAHWPLHAKPEDIEHYRGRYEMGWDALRESRHARMQELGVVDPAWELSPRDPDVSLWQETPYQDWQQRRMEVYAAQVTSMDRNIGRVVAYLKENEAFDDTLILYHHDNGGCHVEYGEKRFGSWTREFTTDGKRQKIRPGNIPGLMPGPQSTFQSYGYGWANASNTPFRLFKQFDHEGGTRSPLVVSWPKGIDASREGTVTHQVSHAVDILPTLLEIAGVKDFEQQPLPLEGLSLSATLLGTEAVQSEPRVLFWNHAKGKAIRDGEWKLVAKNNGPWELYNLASDGTELHDLADAMPQNVAELETLFTAWAARTDFGKLQKNLPEK